MNIKHENVPGQVQEIVIEIQKEDYAENVDKALKKQRREVAVPGFRKGNAPMGIVQKMYGKNILVMEIDRIVNEQIDKYFKDNDVKYIFEPMPVEGKSKVDFDNPDNFTFTYEYALRPEVKIDYKSMPAVIDFTIVPGEEEIKSYIDQQRERHGKYITPDTVEKNDSVSVDFGGEKEAFFFIRDLKEDAQKAICGKKVDEKVSLSRASFANDAVFARAFDHKVEELNADDPYNYEITIKRIGRIEPAELNEEFFKAAYPNGNVTDEKSMKEDAKNMLAEQYKPDTERLFMNKAIETLLDNVKVELPDDFMKRYIKAVQKDMDDEKLEKEFDQYKRSFAWQIMENTIVEGEDVNVTRADVENYFRDYFIKSYFGNFNPESVKDQVDKIVADAMKNQEYVKNAYDLLYDKKLVEVLRKKMNIDHKEGDFKAFVDVISPKEGKTEEAKPKKTTKRKTAAKAEEAAPAEAPAEEKPKKTRAKSTKKADKE